MSPSNNERGRFLVRVGYFVVLGYVLLKPDWFGAGSVTQEYAQDFTNQVFGSQYHSKAQSDITALLLTDAWQARERPWPPSYRSHARVLNALRAHRPKAVFIDILFVDERKDPSLEELVTALRRYDEGAKSIPVYVAQHPQESGPEIIAPLKPLVDEGIVTLVPVPGHLDPSGPTERSYPLMLQAEEGGAEEPAVALTLYNDLMRRERLTQCELRERFGDAMEVIWGTVPPRINRQWMACGQVHESFLSALWAKILPGDNGASPTCPFTQTLFARDLVYRANDTDVQSLVQGNVVLYGMKLDGTGNWIYPPVHRALPAMYAHAMALDNLATFGTDYVRRVRGLSERTLMFWAGEFLVILCISILYALQEGRTGLTEREAKWRSLALWALFSFALIPAWSYLNFSVLHIAAYHWVSYTSFVVAIFVHAFRVGHGFRDSIVEAIANRLPAGSVRPS